MKVNRVRGGFCFVLVSSPLLTSLRGLPSRCVFCKCGDNKAIMCSSSSAIALRNGMRRRRDYCYVAHRRHPYNSHRDGV
jgi:hypothetical protein